MDKWSHIDFTFRLELFKDNVGFRRFLNNNKLDLVYVSVHSSQSVFKTGNLQPIHITFDPNIKFVNSFEFSKIIVQNLQWPHETNCLKNTFISKFQRIYSFDDCVNSCILDKIYAKNKCIQTNETFEIDISDEKISRELKICEKNITTRSDTRKIEMYCLRICHQNCIEEYIQIYFYNRNENLNKSIIIKSANSPLFQYYLIPKNSIFVYASNLGGIISMWFGVAVIDLHHLMIQFLLIFDKINTKIRLILNALVIYKIPIIYELIILFGFMNRYISLISSKIYKFNWRLLFKIICLICFAYQSIEMTKEYLEYRTKVNIRIVEDIMIGNLFNVESNPAFTFCMSNNVTDKSKTVKLLSKLSIISSKISGRELRNKNLEKFFKDCQIKSGECSVNHTHYEKVLNNQTLVSDYLNVIDLKEYSVYCDYFTDTCLSGLILSHHMDSICYTFKSKLSDKFEKTSKNQILFLNIPTLEGFLYIHDPNQLPSFPTSEFPSIPKNRIFYEKKIFKLLPAPYETHCFDYTITSYRSQSECINEHIIQKYLEHNCLPKNNQMITYVIDNYNYSKFRHKFCENISINISIESLKEVCRKSCNEVLYEIWHSNEISVSYRSRRRSQFSVFVDPIEIQNIAFEHNPEMVFMQYLVNFGGLLGLWHGLSITDLKNSIINLFKRKILGCNGRRNTRNYLSFLKLFKTIRSHLKIKVRRKKLCFTHIENKSIF